MTEEQKGFTQNTFSFIEMITDRYKNLQEETYKKWKSRHEKRTHKEVQLSNNIMKRGEIIEIFFNH